MKMRNVLARFEASKKNSTSVAPLKWRFLRVCGQKTLHKIYIFIYLKGGDFLTFSDMMEVLKEENKGRIVFCNNGSFYVAIGNDAILLNKVLDLQLSCMKTGLCKVGFPIEALEKYTGLLIKSGYSFVVYDFNSEKEDLVIIISCTGKRLNYETARNKCFTCEKNKNKDKKIDKYTCALIKMYEQEEKEIREEKRRKKEEKSEKENKELEKIERKLENILLKLKNGE